MFSRGKSKILKCADLKMVKHRMFNVRKVIPIVMEQQETYQNNSENI